MFFSNLFFKKLKRTGRSFGRISLRHRGGGHPSLIPKNFNFSYFHNYNYFLKRFCFLINVSKSQYINVFVFPKSFNKLVFFTQSLYRSFDVFNNYFVNTRSEFPFVVDIFNPRLLNLSMTASFFSEDSDYFNYSPFQTNFLFVINGCFINQIFKNPIAQNSTFSKSFFSYSKFIRKTGFKAYVRLPSKKLIELSVFCRFNFFGYGELLRAENLFKATTNAGSNRRRGVRPSVRGVAMNPIDHPHGGRTGESRPSVTPWAKLTKGYPTVRTRKHSRFK